MATAVPVERDAVAGAFTATGRSLRLPGTTLERLSSASRDSAEARVTLDLLAAGVGPAAAAAGAATALALHRYDLVVSAGIAGGFAPHAP
ncbi:futalosine hydrolase, partial [Streptomyces mirabilis]